MNREIVIIGAGAAGVFAAINAAIFAKQSQLNITILENTSFPLKKVKISGGGRCNFTHNQFDIKEFIKSYPRGKKELISPFHQFHAQDIINWFDQRNIPYKAETDGRIFPRSNKSQTIIDCFQQEIEKYNINLITNIKVLKISKEKDFLIETDHQPFQAHKVLIATGSSSTGHKLAKSLGHTITDLAPSLFSFQVNHPLINNLAGTSFPNAQIQLKANKKKFSEFGPLLLTHRGLSGPVVLKISSWAARELKHEQYQVDLLVNWTGQKRIEIEQEVEKFKFENSNKLIQNFSSQGYTKNFWKSFIETLGIKPDKKWHELSNKEFNKIIDHLYSFPFKMHGQNRFKEEFVECGGINLKEIDFSTMESKLIPNLFFAGEVLDIDGLTGGFNFQNAWTTGFIAAKHMTLFS